MFNLKKIFLSVLFLLNIFVFIYLILTNNYPLFAVLINIFSILALWYCLLPKNIFLYVKNKKFDVIIIASLFLLAFSVYLYNIDVVTPGIQGDELAIAKGSEQILNFSQFFPFVNLNLGHPTPLLYFTGLSIKVFGRSVMAIRLPYIFFGVLSVVAFYVLLRLFFKKSIATAVSLLFLFSYPVIILSRLAYEIMPAMFFQILTAIFLYLAWKKEDIRYYIAVGLAIGAGFYTYLGFRSFALIALILTATMLYRARMSVKDKLQRGYVLLIVLFIAVTPLLSYSLTHNSDVMTRTSSLSIFNYQVSPNELFKEFLGNVSRLSHLFFFDGDQQVKNNPSGIHMFDYGTFILFIIGLYFLFKKNKTLLLFLLLFSISPIVNDIFTLERITDFHEYGQGHPNTLRIAGIIPVIYFSIAYGLDKMKPYIESMGQELATMLLYIAIIIICFFNWYFYFNAPFSGYILNFNGVIPMDIVTAVNKSGTKEVAVPPDLYNDDRFNYFIRKDISVKIFAPKNYNDAISNFNANQMTIVDPVYNRQLYQQLFIYGQSGTSAIQMLPIMNPLINSIDAVAFIKSSQNSPLQQILQ